ncbi:CheY-like chemotaxis protein/CHASE3 domain sensor protein/Skp family chaperone for outer membrane proteins [Duganella sp. 1224]|uniref:response regulator n=1 Tax=Duganella sp. 1224 TaxID=2587052 RepID=UPI0015CA47B0|nr:response regulator [Duganella sp. 1224]NYE62950.1 CheY-like chemotaxis protein/CHASE3 domain sensor protein/Skp family chaperone for outer membrane proteins [Duganella sp. 1224]
MPNSTTLDDRAFRRILVRNVTLPLAAGVVSAGVFVVLLAYLITTMNWVEHSERVIGNANQVGKEMVDMETGLRGYMLAGDEVFLQPYIISKPKVAANLAGLMKLVEDNPAQVDRLRSIQYQQQQWDQYAQEMIRLRAANGDVTGPVKTGRGKTQFDEIRRQLDTFVATEVRMRQDRNDEARTVTTWVAVVYLILTLGVGGILAWFGRRELTGLSRVYTKALGEHAEHARQLQQQAWLRTGQSELAQQGIGQMALPQLSSALLHFLARYMGVVVGALYLRQADGSFRRVASYGFSDAWEQRDQQIKPAESLVAQAALERRVLRLEPVPADYIQVASGLGGGAPASVLVAPVDSDGVVNGVIELGLLRPVAERDIDLLTLVRGNIGSAIEASHSRQRLQEVLAETQQLNEELQVQQEELRTANEELEEQSRVLEESQASLENQKAELEQTNEQLAEQSSALDQKNAELLKAQQDLEERARDLERASQYKSQFLANMSHELRTPLNSSLILAKLLAENALGNLNDEQVRFANTIYSAGNDLLNLINDILDISKVEAGKLDLVPENLSIRHVVEGMAMVFEPLAQQKKLAFQLQVADGADGQMVTDRQRLEQILKNLLSNALKFTSSGQITLSVQPAANGAVAFAVQDTGIGIRPEDQQGIFNAFQQADGTTSRKYGGTGLGLAISRDLAHLLGGAISLVSEPGKGSCFTLTLPTVWTDPAPGPRAGSATTAAAVETGLSALPRPLEPAATPAPAPAPAAPRAFDDDRAQLDAPDAVRGRLVLVVEDDVPFAHILYDLAHEKKYQCLVAFDAEEGLALARQYKPDAVLLDVRLPDRSGLSVLQLLKDDAQTRHIPVHVVSGSDNGEAALHLGAIGYALKPTTREQLMEVFRRIESKLTQKIKRVLLVEDDDRQRDSVVQLISDDDVEIVAVGSGEEALALLRTTIYDCMIIDLKLPDMQGNELLQRMSAESLAAFPPVIVYTGRNLSRAEEADLHKYSRSIIIKGARSPERLLDEVTLFLHKVEADLSSERQRMLKTVRSRDRVFEGRRILLVDDDVRNIFALTSALEQKGALVEVGRNGHEALEKLDTVPDIDLVLMDVMMPGMDGLEATRRLRDDPRFARLPVIAITAKAMKDDQEQCLAAGASDYLAKPIDLSRLYSLLRVWMPNAERS